MSVEVDPTRDTIIYAGTNGAGLLVSRDKGETWNNLLENASVYAIAINRKNPDMILIGTENGLSISRNGGSRFQPLAIIKYNGKVYPYNGLGCIAFDETATQAVLVGIDGGLFKTFDFGKTWEPAGLSEYEITSISIDNSGPKAVIYAGTTDGGIFASANYGMTWRPINSGINDLSVNALLCDRMLHNILYAGTLGGGVYVSSDYGDNWKMITVDLRSLSGYTLEQAVDPQTNRSIVYVGNYDGEIFMTEDGGNTFAKVGERLVGKPVLCLSCSNVLPSSLYLGTNDGLYVRKHEAQDNPSGETADSVLNDQQQRR
ncbi:MAG: hypothetical protein ABIK83_13385 [Candidatus Zixiibacteriota bacterium]